MYEELCGKVNRDAELKQKSQKFYKLTSVGSVDKLAIICLLKYGESHIQMNL